ncbi:MAG: membrane-bound lytic murein transglycosylase MltF, partial [Spongiibacteraceae bacterium]|nr:membrane-bound lytic murein transglycosylase MltF [Spongiibacteraceae bacterium]
AFAPPYLDVEHLVVVRNEPPLPLSTVDLIGRRLHIMANTGHAEVLGSLQADHPELTWTEAEDVETIDLLDALDAGEIDATVIDSNEFIANRGFYTQLRAAFRLGEPTQLAWAARPGPGADALLEELDRFFANLRESGELDQLIERFYSHSEYNDQLNSREFVRNVENRLPQYLDMIQTVAAEFDMDWRLLAAISYQESHWNPRAVSPTGVVGFMMLTQPTAKALGVTNRRDALQSLRGGALYLKRIHQRLPSRVAEPDRTWFALAAYNVGLGHLEDARIITRQQGRDPDKWADVKEHLPLLRKRQWYRNTRYGYARGNEPVHYVQNIRHYYNVLTWTDLARQRVPPPRITDQYLPEGFDIQLNAL